MLMAFICLRTCEGQKSSITHKYEDNVNKHCSPYDSHFLTGAMLA